MTDTPLRKLKGIAVSSGIIIGKARLIDRSRVKILYQYLISDQQVNKEVERFKDALNAAKDQIIHLKNRMPEQIKRHSFILDSHLMIMDDSMFFNATINGILSEKINAEWALKKSVQNIESLFSQIDDPYIKERIVDVEYVAERVLRNLAGKEQESLYEISERVIIVAHELSPADTSSINIGKVMGFITDVGGRTSHAAIIAQSLKIPAVVGLESVTRQVQEGTLLIVDGNTGEVIIDPDDDLIIDYQEKQLNQEKFESSIIRLSHLPAETKDRHLISVRANIEFLEEVATAKDHGAEGIGLYRTEFHYLRSQGLPTEDELFEDYKEVAEIIAPNPVTIRTLDLGGDRFSSELSWTKETNPALGLRAIRFCLQQPKMFRSQLRAILRASAFGNIQVMFPMISGLQELLDARKMLKEVMAELDQEGVPCDRNIKVGLMIEVPSAVTVADILAKHADFFSIGTNDLIQYALAIDRVNAHVAFMYQPFHPAILRMILQVIKAAKQAGIKVALCGEMAGDPLCTSVLLAMGIDELSLNAGGIPMIKKMIRSLSLDQAKTDLRKIMKLDTASQVREFIVKKMQPLLDELDHKLFMAAGG
ncbi:MAG: phosphoenolpyruvate--protein phosphotransferase [Deltaproteobacteria bacterium]|nr:phosphoenolpyruvate--protein phosphotransferase [Deltaproteobacteria bacterium]